MRSLLVAMIISMVFTGCTPDEDYSFQGSKSVVENFRKEGYYEYSSRLNDILFAELNSMENDILSASMLETIETLSEKIKNDRHPAGCYVIEWESEKAHNDVITLEWNDKHGVIIRMFTKSLLVKRRLPLNSY